MEEDKDNAETQRTQRSAEEGEGKKEKRDEDRVVRCRLEAGATGRLCMG
jgi:hypothetical protein